MSREVQVELTNMCMVCDGDKVLVQNRVKPGWPGAGGECYGFGYPGGLGRDGPYCRKPKALRCEDLGRAGGFARNRFPL